ncbi:MAG: DNA-methyltransferase [Alphaproteobacteria bacterium]
MLNINKIYNLDCFDFLDKIDNQSIDLVITDPPYNMKKEEWDCFLSEKHFFTWTYRWLEKVVDKIKANGSLYVFNTPYNSAHILLFLCQKNMIFQNWLTWDKRDGMGGAKRKYSNGQETILFFTKSNDHIFNYDDIRVPYESTERINHAKEKGILKNGKRWFPNSNGKLCGEVWHIASERHHKKINGKVQKLFHITPKPYTMIERMVKASSNRGDLVMDCFVGSGTTAVVAQDLCRNFIVNDKTKEYFLEAKKNIKLGREKNVDFGY